MIQKEKLLNLTSPQLKKYIYILFERPYERNEKKSHKQGQNI